MPGKRVSTLNKTRIASLAGEACQISGHQSFKQSLCLRNNLPQVNGEQHQDGWSKQSVPLLLLHYLFVDKQSHLITQM